MNKTKEISNTEDVIDSRDIIERIGYLEDEKQSLEDAIEDAETDETTYSTHNNINIPIQIKDKGGENMQEVYMVVDKMPSTLIVVSFIAMYLVAGGLIKLAWAVLNIKD